MILGVLEEHLLAWRLRVEELALHVELVDEVLHLSGLSSNDLVVNVRYLD